MDTMINLIVKVQQFEDKRILAKASWNIKELKGKLSEIYPTSTEEQKLIYSGKLLNDTVVLKDVLREYEGQEAHTVHLVFTPKTSSRLQTILKENSSINTTSNQSQSSDMSTSELRQRHTATTAATVPEQQQQATTNIPSNYYNAFYGNMPFDANSVLAQQYAMQTWMQQAYAQYMNQYMNIVQQQQTQQAPNFAGFMQPQMPFIAPTIVPTSPTSSTIQSSNSEIQTASASPPAQPQAQVEQAPQPPAAAEPQRRFPNIIQDEQENRDWLDIVYSMSRLLILLCLVYFYSSPLRCLIVILIGISIYLYHIYRQNQNRLNNNNTTRVNLNNVNRPPQAPAAAPRPENGEERPENAENPTEENQNAESSETEPLVNASDELLSTEPQVSWLTIARTFVVSFVASIIPEHPAM
ncbi:unnamed protein product [Chironomus riparius]|uniref:Ubiquitin-like domain-containing protein n=2 Tax=Chironomus riparius TaxID=315576 RepID=A0A9N9RK79_9DIPT|nr:unnamed protein product [Chironomus riparius]